MHRVVCSVVGGLLLYAGVLLAQEGIQRGKIKNVDPDKKTIVITFQGKDYTFLAGENSRFMDEAGQPIKDRLADKRLRPGAAVMFKAGKKDGKDVLIGVKLGGNPVAVPPPKVDLTGLKPLTELGEGEYKGSPGGLYPGGKNERPAAHEAAGRELAKEVRPLDRDGQPVDDGKIVLLSVGMSNTTQEFSVFKTIAEKDTDKNPRLVLVDGRRAG